jgi:hypothetical protein
MLRSAVVVVLVQTQIQVVLAVLAVVVHDHKERQVALELLVKVMQVVKDRYQGLIDQVVVEVQAVSAQPV